MRVGEGVRGRCGTDGTHHWFNWLSSSVYMHVVT